ncbi:MAG TPA: metallophosphoesterase [Polyangiaceae bacterium]|nr:metallophosphoesterase [Polyangiaceae bacterium]
MPDDGVSSAGADDARRRSLAASRRSRAHQRRRRILWVAHAITAAMHAPLVLGAALLVGAGWAVAIGVAASLVTAVRLQRILSEGRRSRAFVVLVDMPVFVHWSATLLATFAFWPIAVLLAFGVRALWGFDWGAFHAVAGAGLVSYGVGLVVAAYGSTIRRHWVHVVHVEVPIAGLRPELDGYRIAQMSDLHIGNFDSKKRGLEWVDRVNRLAPDLVAVTGDLVTTGKAFYEDVADVIAALRAPGGVYVSMGNHDQWDPDELSRLIEARGPSVLRNRWRAVEKGGATLVVAGIDDRMTGQDDLDATLAGRPEHAPTVLLSHYPDFFDEAARRGVELTLSGHTHGGQIAVPFLARRASLSALAGQARHGLHVRGGSRLYVNAGLGTTGPPFRLGIAPEITMFVLRSV